MRMRIVPASDSALFVSFGDTISPETHQRVIGLFHAIEQLQDSRIRNLHPAYSSLLIDFDPLRMTHAELESLVRPLIDSAVPWNYQTAIIEIPVCYDREFGPDLQAVAQHTSRTEEQVIRLHSSGEYFVYFLGFSPGFAYLGGLARELHVPRLRSPRKLVPAGSVGLAGKQTGIYPNDSPGGWRLIGRTPLPMFVANADPPARLRPGDRVRFRTIDRSEFDRLAAQLESADAPHY